MQPVDNRLHQLFSLQAAWLLRGWRRRFHFGSRVRQSDPPNRPPRSGKALLSWARRDKTRGSTRCKRRSSCPNWPFSTTRLQPVRRWPTATPPCYRASLPPQIAPQSTSAWAQYTIRVAERNTVQTALQAAGVPTAVHYPVPLNRQPAVAAPDAVVPHSDTAAEEVMSLAYASLYKAGDAGDWIIAAVLQAELKPAGRLSRRSARRDARSHPPTGFARPTQQQCIAVAREKDGVRPMIQRLRKLLSKDISVLVGARNGCPGGQPRSLSAPHPFLQPGRFRPVQHNYRDGYLRWHCPYCSGSRRSTKSWAPRRRKTTLSPRSPPRCC